MAMRNVTRNRRRSIITGGSIILGVTAILFSDGYIAGLHRLIESSVTEAGSGAIQVQRRGYLASQELATLELDLPQSSALEERIRGVSGVQALTPRLRFMGIISNGE